jgi:hypothetical protein
MTTLMLAVGLASCDPPPSPPPVPPALDAGPQISAHHVSSSVCEAACRRLAEVGCAYGSAEPCARSLDGAARQVGTTCFVLATEERHLVVDDARRIGIACKPQEP